MEKRTAKNKRGQVVDYMHYDTEDVHDGTLVENHGAQEVANDVTASNRRRALVNEGSKTRRKLEGALAKLAKTNPEMVRQLLEEAGEDPEDYGL